MLKYKLKTESGIDEFHFIDSLLASKGIHDSNKYLSAEWDDILPYYLLDGLKEGADMLRFHLQNKSRIAIVVDDDCDGFLSSALIYKALVEIEGYDSGLLSLVFHQAKKKIHGLQPEEIPEEAQLIIVPDAGTSDYEQWDILNKRGSDILILDHHQAAEPNREIPNKVVIINNQLSSQYLNKQLCGTGVVYKFLQYFLGDNREKIKDWIDLVAFATISDMMSLLEIENRAILNVGLKNINNKFFKSLIEEKSKSPFFKFSPLAISFFIVPSINAVIRLNEQGEKESLFFAIVAPDELIPSTHKYAAPNELETRAKRAIRYCGRAVARQRVAKDSLRSIIRDRIETEGQEKNSIIIGKLFKEDDYNQSLTGLIASALAFTYNRPALVLKYDESSDSWAGSARNHDTAIIPDLNSFLLSSGLVTKAQGHANSFGITIPAKNLDALIECCNSTFPDIAGETVVEVDYITTPFDSSLSRVIKEIDKARDLWGMQIEEPKICVEGIVLRRSEVALLGINADGLKFTKNGIEYIKFKDLDLFNDLTRAPVTALTVIGHANVNHWDGNTIPQIIITDYETSADMGGF